MIDAKLNRLYADQNLAVRADADISIDASGWVTEIAGIEKLKQLIIKSLITSRGNHPWDSSYGSYSRNWIGQKMSTISGVVNVIGVVNECLNNFKNNQQFLAELDPEERIDVVTNVSASMASKTAVIVEVQFYAKNDQSAIAYIKQ